VQQGTLTHNELARLVLAMAVAETAGGGGAFQRMAAMAYVVCSHALAVRASHAGDFTPLGLSTLDVPAEPLKVGCCAGRRHPAMRTHAPPTCGLLRCCAGDRHPAAAPLPQKDSPG
jgi:hypothetical protein